MPNTRSPLTELDLIQSQAADGIERAITRLLRAKLSRDPDAIERAEQRLALVLGRVLIVVDLLGRRRLILERRAFASFAADPARYVTRLPFAEAVKNLLRRTPELQRGYRRVQQAYLGRHVFALAKSTSLTLTRKIQGVIADRIESGAGSRETTRIIRQLGNWTHAYADTVYETNAATAYAAGRMDQAAQLKAEGAVMGFEFLAAGGPSGDGDNRANHLAAHGLIAGVDDVVWDRFSPPLGYRCRCSLVLVDEVVLRRKNLIGSDGEIITLIPPGWANARPDKGFDRGLRSRRPDRMIYGLGVPVGV